ncbi:MAG TPA: HAMP domain-containing sensor histidine kinase [Chloroflexota bacterium]
MSLTSLDDRWVSVGPRLAHLNGGQVIAVNDDPWRELEEMAGNLIRLSERAGRQVVSMPEGGDLVSRLVQVIGLLGSLLIDGRSALARHEAEELRELVNVKSDFLRLTNHELRRPLGLLRGHLSLIAEGTYGQVPEKMMPGLRMVEAGAVEMATLLDGLASIARLEDRTEALRRQPTRLGHLVGDAVATIEPEAAAREITIQQQLPEPDILANVDRDLVRIAVVNLIGNAAKYSPERSTVRVEVSLYDSELTVAVSDEGPGIEPGEAERIFEQWHRAPRETAPGMGLGLYIVRQIMTLHGGRVTIESAPGHSSTFTAVIPR